MLKLPNLSQSNQDDRFRVAFEHASTGMSFVSLGGQWLQVNPALCRMLGYSQAELLGLGWQEIAHPDDLAEDLEQTNRLLRGEIENFSLDKRYIRKDGRIFWVLLNVSLVRDQAGVPLYFITQVRDIDAQKQTQAALHQSEALYRGMIEALEEGIVLQDAEGRILEANPAAERVLGLTRDQMMGRTNMDSRWRAVREDGSDFPGQDHPSMVALLTGQPQRSGLIGIHTPEGRLVWLLVNSQPLFNPGESQPYAVVSSFFDITERRINEQHLIEQEHRFRSAFDLAPIGMALLTIEGRYLRVNPVLCQMLGYSEAELLEASFQQLTHPEDVTDDLELGDQILKGEIESFSKEKRYLHKQGHAVWVLLSVSIICDAGGKPGYYINQVVNISERKKAEQALQSSEERLSLAFEAAGMGWWEWDALANQHRWSAGYERLLGYAPGAFPGGAQAWLERVHPEDRQRMAITAYDLRQQGGQADYRVVLPDGQVRWINSRWRVYRSADGGIERQLGVDVDITPRKQAEESLRNSLQRVGALYQTSRALMSSSDTTQLLHALVDTIAANLRVDRVTLIAFDLAAQRVSHFYTGGEGREEVVQVEFDELMQGLSGWAIREMRPAISPKGIPDPRESPQVQARRARTNCGSIMVFPLHYQGRILGTLTVINRPDQPDFDQEDLDFLEAVTRQVAVVMQNARLFADLEQRASEIEGVNHQLLNEIGERKQVEQALRVSQERLNLAFEAAGMGWWEWDLLKEEHRWSGEFERLLGYAPGAFPGGVEAWIERVHPEDRARLENIAAHLPQQGTNHADYRVLLPGGQTRWIDSRWRLYYGPEGQLERQLGVVVDITPRKRVEEELRDFAARLERSNRELQEFAYVASHDLQEPLRKVQAFGDRLKARYAGDLGPDGLDYLNRMQNAAQRMQTLIQDLLGYSRVTTQTRPLVSVNLQTVALEVVDDLEARLEGGGRVEIGDLGTVRADPMQMRQLLQNLIGNALKFCRPGVPPLVSVYGRYVYEAFELTIEDNGIGFDNKHADKIFAPFQRLHGRGEYEGTGMGLAICRRIAERHGGSILARGVVGQGARFIVTLPESQGGNE